MPKISDLVWVEDIGKEKPAYHKVGIMVEKDDGKRSIKLNSVPVGDFNGWLQIYEQKPKEGGYKQEEAPF